MKKNTSKPNPKLIKGGIQYLRGRLINSRRERLKGLGNYLSGSYL